MTTKLNPSSSCRTLDLEKLVGRSFERPDLTELKNKLTGKTVLITGAGGSIGSEITNQIFSLGVCKLVLVESCEFNLYSIMEKIGDAALSGPNATVTGSLTNICDYEALEELFNKHRPDFVYHAAAYKHVHIVEANPNAGIMNNVVGTKNLLDVSANFGIEKFTLISTDKAVRPTNLMGATKRVCELLISDYAERYGLNCSAVRFGNVAGSSGSLIPKLFTQVQNNDPLTITDKRMTRFFMLIPEAVSLVLKASESSRPGAITLLNMGKSIAIVDMAKKVIEMSGKDPETYPITYIGKRPGEKLFEELSLSEKDLFKSGKMFADLDMGDGVFEEFHFKGKRYKSAPQLIQDMAFYAKNNSELAKELVWAAIENDFHSEAVNEEEQAIAPIIKLQVA